MGWNKKIPPRHMPKTKSAAPPAPTKHTVPCDNFGVRRGGGGCPPPPFGVGSRPGPAPVDHPPMDFLILRPLPPKTGYHFFEGGGWVGGWGGQRFLLRSLQAVGTHIANTPLLVEWQRSRRKVLGRRFVSWPADLWRRRRRLKIHPAGVRTADQRGSGPLHYHSATAWSELKGLPTAWGHICH